MSNFKYGYCISASSLTVCACSRSSEGNEAVPQQIAAVEAKRKTLEQVWPDQLEEHRQRLEAEVENSSKKIFIPFVIARVIHLSVMDTSIGRA
jgi:hypothetical protein